MLASMSAPETWSDLADVRSMMASAVSELNKSSEPVPTASELNKSREIGRLLLSSVPGRDLLSEVGRRVNRRLGMLLGRSPSR